MLWDLPIGVEKEGPSGVDTTGGTTPRLDMWGWGMRRLFFLTEGTKTCEGTVVPTQNEDLTVAGVGRVVTRGDCRGVG